MKKALEVVYPPQDFLHKLWQGPRKIRDHFSPSEDPGVDFTGDPGLTDESQAAECDVNRIVERFMKTGVLPGTDVQGLYGDFSSVPDYQKALDVVMQAEEQFANLDAKVRSRFDNDPEKFLAFATDPKNGQEMVDLGLATVRPEKDVERLERAIRESGKVSPPSPAPKKDKAGARKGDDDA